MSEPTAQLAEVLDHFGRLVAAIRDEQWSLPTPCTDWSVRDLVNHVVSGNRLFATALSDEQPAAPDGIPAADVIGDDATTAYREAATALLAAFRRPDAFDRLVTVPFGTVPGAVALHLRLTELLVHGWDLSRATGIDVTFSAEVAEQELHFTRAALADVPPTRRPFGPPQPAPDDAPAIDRLAALLGRWPTPTRT